jgi:hypothetical protein
VNTVTQGRAFFYNPGSGQGTCSFGLLPADGLYVSLGAPQYAAGAACGSYLDITGPAGTVRAQVVDNCPGCANGGIDMSAAAFRRVANPSSGNPLASVAVRTAGRFRWQPLTLSPDDYWAAPSGAGPGPFQVQVTDMFGHRVVLTGIRLAPGSLQPTRVLMYTAGPPSHHQSAATPASPSGPATTMSPAPGATGSAAAHAGGRSRAAGPGC